MRYLTLLLMMFSISTNAAVVWGKKGHRVTGYIAEQHLTGSAKKAIRDLLDGHSLAYASTYADEIKSDRSFAKYSPWHYVNYPLTMTYAESKKNEAGDIVFAINDCIKVLKDDSASKKDKIFYLKLLIHFMGDLHQPLHAGRAEDRGGNDIQVQWFGEGSNLHRVWDSDMLEFYGMSYYELGDELDRITNKKERKAMQQGSVVDWLTESHDYAKDIYSSVSPGEKLSYAYSYNYNSILFSRLQKGGFRLAKVLNEVFS